jgi:hypothetical protein
VSVDSSPITITVNNPPPSTNVLIPSSGATLNDGSYEIVLDASASPGVTRVSIELVFGSNVVGTFTAVPTIYGWIAVDPPCNCVTDHPVPLPFTVQSVASYSDGVSGTSPPVNVNYIVYTTPPP